MLAARDGDLAAVTELLAAGEPAVHTDASGFSSLIWACKGPPPPAVILLLFPRRLAVSELAPTGSCTPGYFVGF